MELRRCTFTERCVQDLRINHNQLYQTYVGGRFKEEDLQEIIKDSFDCFDFRDFFIRVGDCFWQCERRETMNTVNQIGSPNKCIIVKT